MKFNKNNKVSLNNKELIKGLTNEEVKKHIKEGNYNKSIDSVSKTTKEITKTCKCIGASFSKIILALDHIANIKTKDKNKGSIKLFLLLSFFCLILKIFISLVIHAFNKDNIFFIIISLFP